jgi:uncharacterized protein YndB with AHSA1/START domain
MSQKNRTVVTTEPGKQEVIVNRMFDAPRDLVFQVMNDPNALHKWWGPRSHEIKVVQYDPKPGGSWRIIHTDPSGQKHGFHGVVHDIVAPERIVRTFEYEGMPGHVLMETTTLEDVDGRTKFTLQLVFQSVADRDGMVQSGMESGMAEGHDRLEELLASYK